MSYEQASTPYNQIGQTYFGATSWAFLKEQLGVDARVDYNSAASQYYPDTNLNDSMMLGNQRLVNIGGICANGGNEGVADNPANCFAPAAFVGVEANIEAAATTSISEVKVPQWIGEGRVYYHLPRNFKMGMLVNTGSYHDYLNPSASGDLRSFNVFVGRNW